MQCKKFLEVEGILAEFIDPEWLSEEVNELDEARFGEDTRTDGRGLMLSVQDVPLIGHVSL